MGNWQYIFTYSDGTLGDPRSTGNPFVNQFGICAGTHEESNDTCRHETFLQDLDEIPEVKSLLKVKSQPVTPPITIEINEEELFKFDPVIRQWYFKLNATDVHWLCAGQSLSKLLDEVVKIV